MHDHFPIHSVEMYGISCPYRHTVLSVDVDQSQQPQQLIVLPQWLCIVKVKSIWSQLVPFVVAVVIFPYRLTSHAFPATGTFTFTTPIV